MCEIARVCDRGAVALWLGDLLCVWREGVCDVVPTREGALLKDGVVDVDASLMTDVVILGRPLIQGASVGVDTLRTATLRLVMVALATPASLASQE